MNAASDEYGFIVVYPDGAGKPPLLTWNAGGFNHGIGSQANDVKFLSSLLDDVESIANVDKNASSLAE